MASIGPNSPSTSTNDTSIGNFQWINPSNVNSSNNVYTTISRTTPGPTTSQSNYIKSLNFGFSIPGGATIDGIVVEIEKKSSINSSGYGVEDLIVKLVKAGTVVGTNNAATGTLWPTTEAVSSYGSSSNLWGTTLTSTDVNDSTFGVVLQAAIHTPSKTTLTASIDHIKITVYYTGGAMDACSTLLAGD